MGGKLFLADCLLAALTVWMCSRRLRRCGPCGAGHQGDVGAGKEDGEHIKSHQQCSRCGCSEPWKQVCVCACVHFKLRTHVVDLKSQLTAVVLLFFSGPQITFLYQQKAVSILPTFCHCHSVHIRVLQRFLCHRSVTDDSEEWTADDEEPLSPGPESTEPQDAV